MRESLEIRVGDSVELLVVDIIVYVREILVEGFWGGGF